MEEMAAPGNSLFPNAINISVDQKMSPALPVNNECWGHQAISHCGHPRPQWALRGIQDGENQDTGPR